MSTHDLCFTAKIRKNVYPCKPQFYYINVGCKGVYSTRACFHDAILSSIRLSTLLNAWVIDHSSFKLKFYRGLNYSKIHCRQCIGFAPLQPQSLL